MTHDSDYTEIVNRRNVGGTFAEIMRAVKRINPIYVMIALNVIAIVLRSFILPEETMDAWGAAVESVLLSLGAFGYVGLVLAYVVCSFFFIPLLIPLNILGGALYGGYIGTAVASVGITLGSIATIVSVRYVFKGMQFSLDERPRLKQLLSHADRHRNLVIVIVRFTVVFPYLWQNVALAVTSSSIVRITLLTTFSVIPGAAIFSFLGAGLVHADQVHELVFYLALPVVLLLIISGGLVYIRKKYEEP
jgi:uncharacterized membrane protein YdjX (TVP38/TMEM64 family)